MGSKPVFQCFSSDFVKQAIWPDSTWPVPQRKPTKDRGLVYNYAVRILVLADASSPHTLRWCRGLASLGHKITLASGQRFSQEANSLPVEKVQLRNRGRMTYWKPEPIVKELGKEHDTVFAHFLPSYGVMAARAGFAFVLGVWGSDVLIWPHKSPWHARAARWVLSNAVHILADAFCVRRVLEVAMGYPGDRISVFPFGPEETAKLKREKTSKGIIYTRGLGDIYGFKTALRALDMLREKGLRVQMRVTQPSASEALPEAREELVFLGHVPKEEYLRAMAKSRIYFSPALSDATPVSMLEAMAAGLIPVVSDLPATREWVVDGVNGLLFDPLDPESAASALEQALQDEELAENALNTGPNMIRLRANWAENLRAFDKILQLCPEKTRPKLNKPIPRGFWSYWRD